jgi:hypothetical protein
MNVWQKFPQSLALILVAIPLLLPASMATRARAADEESVPYNELTPRQRLDYSEDTVTEVKDAVRKVLKMVGVAQKDKEVLLLNCLNEKLAGLKALLKVVEDADLAMQEALARENNDLAAHEFQKIDMARGQAQQLIAEADACVPEVGVSYAGRGRWSKTTPDDLDDEGQYESDPSGYTRPPEESPFT